jgi:hypothetical protein
MCTSGIVSEVSDDYIRLMLAHTNKSETSETSAAVGYKYTII